MPVWTEQGTNSIKNNIMGFSGVSDRIAILSTKFGGKKLTLIQVYAPTSASPEEENSNFYKTLEKTLEKIIVNNNNQLIIMGDFNSQVGQAEGKEEKAVGPYGIQKKRNDRGKYLVHFCMENNLKIANSFFKKRFGKKWTWLSPNALHKNEIDFFLTPNVQLFQDVEATNKFSFQSDHRLLKQL